MLRFAANLTTMYAGMPVLEAMKAARDDGFTAVECRAPFADPKERVAERLAELGLTMVQFNTPMGDFAAGERGLACLPGRVDDFRASVETSLDYAKALGCSQINCPAGVLPRGARREDLEPVLAENLKFAARRFAEIGVRLQLEAINPVDTPGAFIWTTAQCERMLKLVDDENLYLQYDFYHMQVVQGDLVRTYERLRERINHVQIADNPGRHEPGTGEINHPFIFSELQRLGYSGWIGCEYVPRTTAREGLGWLALASGDHHGG
ncbi:hydroxypyruvate isomerase family protein [Faunimonas sp. B44]|uniref:hydroxypyruvate isomerase family protein n=1 Tax=Faunimonas sp. B44 TaxID=3461493 RepID=UPI0040444E69